jgi:type II secretory pathway pseudopilin PulG
MMNRIRHRQYRRPDRRGFTLLELILYLGVIGLVLTAVIGFTMTFLDAQSSGVAYREVGRDGRYAIERIAAEMRAATGINLGDSTFGISPGRISLSTSTPATNPTIFDVSSSAVVVSRGGSAFEPVISGGSQVDSFIIRNVSVTGRSRVYRVELQLSSTDETASQVSQTFETTGRVRRGQGHP